MPIRRRARGAVPRGVRLGRRREPWLLLRWTVDFRLVVVRLGVVFGFRVVFGIRMGFEARVDLVLVVRGLDDVDRDRLARPEWRTEPLPPRLKPPRPPRPRAWAVSPKTRPPTSKAMEKYRKRLWLLMAMLPSQYYYCGGQG